ncbi:MAG: AAA family ATPase [Desulfobacterales bacterium]|nr:MAG: AAA family ATPase [Desulfobacterales bacterium]
MEVTRKNILITGAPGTGKTTFIKRLLQELRNFHPVGFYTAELRKGGQRRGFAMKGVDGREGILAHVEFQSPFKVGRYSVDVAGFDDFIRSIAFLDPAIRLIILDEIGKMECFSENFRRCVREILDSDKCVIATIALKGGGLIAEIKRRPDIFLVELTRHNQEALFAEIVKIAATYSI